MHFHPVAPMQKKKKHFSKLFFSCFSVVVPKKQSALLICSLSSCHWFQRKAKHLQANWNPWSKHSWWFWFSKMPSLSSAKTWFSSKRCCTWVQNIAFETGPMLQQGSSCCQKNLSDSILPPGKLANTKLCGQILLRKTCCSATQIHWLSNAGWCHMLQDTSHLPLTEPCET